MAAGVAVAEQGRCNHGINIEALCLLSLAVGGIVVVVVVVEFAANQARTMQTSVSLWPPSDGAQTLVVGSIVDAPDVVVVVVVVIVVVVVVAAAVAVGACRATLI